MTEMPGAETGVVAGYRDLGELERASRLAVARQELAHEGAGYVPPWAGLTDHERYASVLEARHWLRAAERAGLIPPPVPPSGACPVCGRVMRLRKDGTLKLHVPTSHRPQANCRGSRQLPAAARPGKDGNDD